MITSERLVEIVTEALERTCFLVSDPSDQEALVDRGHRLARSAAIRYSGPDSGDVHVLASDGFLQELASSMLGVEPEEIDLEVEGRDAIRELANILGGSVILELGGDNCEYRLGLPEETTPAEVAPGTACHLESAFGALKVVWSPQEAAEGKAA